MDQSPDDLAGFAAMVAHICGCSQLNALAELTGLGVDKHSCICVAVTTSRNIS